MKDFTKSDLKNRMVVELRNGTRYVVIDDKILSSIGYDFLSTYNEDLTMEKGPSKHDIVKVYDQIYCIDFNKNSLNLLWERSEVKEVTMAEVEEKFGCKVKIVKE